MMWTFDGCSRCGLSKTRICIVPCRGKHELSEILFIGDAPGVSEDMLGKCFVGSSGKLLNQMISRAKISDTVCYFTNTVLCRPCNSKSGGNREPRQEEVFACMPNVKEVIDTAENIQMVVLVGLIAKKYYASRFKGMPLLEITHPEAILRKGGTQSSLFYDNVRKLERFWHDNNC